MVDYQMGKKSRLAAEPIHGGPLEPLMEEPSPDAYADSAKKYSSWGVLLEWLKSHKSNGGNRSCSSGQCSDLQLMLGVLGCPLGPISILNDPLPHLSIKDVPFVSVTIFLLLLRYVIVIKLRIVFFFSKFCFHMKSLSEKALLVRIKTGPNVGSYFILQLDHIKF